MLLQNEQVICHSLGRIFLKDGSVFSFWGHLSFRAGGDGSGKGATGAGDRESTNSPGADFSLRRRRSIGSATTSGRAADRGNQQYQDEAVGAGDGNRTHVSSLGSCSSTIELHPHDRA